MTIQSVGQLKALAQQAGFPDPATAAAIAEAESSGNPDVVNSIGCVGLWQINQPAWASKGWSVAWLQVPANNAAAAYIVYQAQGWQAWTTYTSGAYKQYMSGASSASTDQPTSDNGPLPSYIPGSQTVNNTVNTVNSVAELVSKLSQPQTWKQILYILVGIILVIMGLVKMGTQNKTLQSAAKAAGKVAEVAAL